jgi:hypothetical protein
VVAGYGRGGEEEAAPVEGGERRRRRLSDIQSRAEGGGRRCTAARGTDRAGLGRVDRVATRPNGLFGLKMREKGKRASGLFFPIFQTKI